jgi:RNA polymerase sigma factor for flagellar operon FliA
MEINVISPRGRDSVRSIHDFLKDFSLTPEKIDSFKNILSKAIEELPYEEKVVLSLYHCEEMTLAEIGKILGKTERDIFQVFRNAISNLRSKIHSRA